MLDDEIPNKSAAGQHEITQRSRKLSPRQRMLLIAVNGHASVAELHRQFGAVGDFDELLQSLADLGLIEAGTATPSAVAAAPPRKPVAPTPAPTAKAAASAVLSPAPVPATNTTPRPTGVSGAKQLMNETAFANFGMRAYMYTLKLEQCYSADEVLALLPDFARVLTAAKGETYANALQLRVKAMLAAENASA